MTKVYLLICLGVLLGCNTPKHLAKQADAINKLTDKVNASKVLQVKDSIVFIPGQMQSVRDTVLLIDSAPGKTIERYYVNTYNFTHDSVKYFTRDAVRENALQNELMRANAQSDAQKTIAADLKKWVYRAFAACSILLIICGAVLFTKIKNPLKWISNK